MVSPLPSMTSTHCVLPSVLTVRVSAAPCLAYTVPFAAVKVPAPPLNAALVTDAALAAGRLTTPMLTSVAETATSESRAGRRNVACMN